MATAEVYAIGREDGAGLIKVGFSRDSGRRALTLSVSEGEPLVIHHCARCEFGAAGAAERIVHESFRERRVRGEWFDVSPSEVIAAIDSAVAVALGRVSPYANNAKQVTRRGPAKIFLHQKVFRLRRRQDEKLTRLARKWGLVKPDGKPDTSSIIRKLIDDADDR